MKVAAPAAADGVAFLGVNVPFGTNESSPVRSAGVVFVLERRVPPGTNDGWLRVGKRKSFRSSLSHPGRTRSSLSIPDTSYRATFVMSLRDTHRSLTSPV